LGINFQVHILGSSNQTPDRNTLNNDVSPGPTQSAINPESGLIIKIDKQKICQVVRNLLSNALKFTTAGGEITVVATVVLVSASVKRDFEVSRSGKASGPTQQGSLSPPYFRFEVADTGPGISLVRYLLQLHLVHISIQIFASLARIPPLHTRLVYPSALYCPDPYVLPSDLFLFMCNTSAGESESSLQGSGPDLSRRVAERQRLRLRAVE